VKSLVERRPEVGAAGRRPAPQIRPWWAFHPNQRRVLIWLFLLAGLCIHPASPSSPEQLRGRIGFYQWRGTFPIHESRDLLTLARRKSVETGARVFRFYLGGRFDYVHPVLSPQRFEGDGLPRPVTLEGIISLPRYRAVLADPALETIVLTAYPVYDYGGGPDDLNLQRPWGPQLERLEREQITALANWLYREFGDSNKTIIVANHEADEKIIDIANYTGSPEQAVTTFRLWMRTRFEAIDAVRKAHPGARLRFFHAFEIALVNLRVMPHRGGFRKATPRNPRQRGWSALLDVVPHTPFDLISYSAYESTNSPYETQNPDQPPPETGVRLKRDLERIRAVARPSLSAAGRQHFGENFVMIGELGYARDRFEHLPSGPILPRLYSAMQASIESGCPYVVLWQVFDHPLNGGEAWGFGMYNRDGKAVQLKAPEGGCRSIRECLSLLFSKGFDAWAGRNRY
jgi:hypothetical protein